MKVVADSNVLVSAFVFGGKPQAILDLAQDGHIELFISDEIVAETTRVLRDKFHRTPEQLRADVRALAVTDRGPLLSSCRKGSSLAISTLRVRSGWHQALKRAIN